MQIGERIITLGADPELFLVDDNGLVSALDHVSGHKRAPTPITQLGSGFAYQADNVLLEYNIPPAKSLTSWEDYHAMTLDYLKGMLVPKGLKYKILGSAEMPESALMHPMSHVFGCEPSFNVWSLEKTLPEPGYTRVRSAGGHIHIGYPLKPFQVIRAAKYLDICLGLSSVLLDKKEKDRRQFYGKAGEIRWKPYGFEYRVLSNFWLRSKKQLKDVYRIVVWVINHLDGLNEISKEYAIDIQSAINDYDIAKAQYLIERHSNYMHLTNDSGS